MPCSVHQTCLASARGCRAQLWGLVVPRGEQGQACGDGGEGGPRGGPASAWLRHCHGLSLVQSMA